MKNLTVPIDSAGRIVLPKQIREELAIDPGDLLDISVRGTEVTLRPRKNESGFIRQEKALVFSSNVAGILHNDEVNEIIQNIREHQTVQTSKMLSSGTTKK